MGERKSEKDTEHQIEIHFQFLNFVVVFKFRFAVPSNRAPTSFLHLIFYILTFTHCSQFHFIWRRASSIVVRKVLTAFFLLWMNNEQAEICVQRAR